jgi:hypothetical protein
MTWDVTKPIRVGDNVDNLLLGEFAKEIDALHDGFVSESGSTIPSVGITNLISSLDNASGIDPVVSIYNPPFSIYSFSNGYKRKPPYLVVASFRTHRPTTATYKAWIIRQPVFISDVGRETTDVAQYTPQWNTELAFNTLISNIDANGEPDGYLVADTTTAAFAEHRHATVVRLVEDDLPARYKYSNGDTLTNYNDYFHIALAPVGGSTANIVSIFQPSLTIIGGR